ncbi:MAG: glycosyltransferase family 87 protein [Aureliella sp.]
MCVKRFQRVDATDYSLTINYLQKYVTEQFMDDQPDLALETTQSTTPLRELLIGSLLLVGLLLVFSPNYRWNVNKGESPFGSDFLQDWTAASMIAAGEADGLYRASAFDTWQHDANLIGFSWNADSYYPAVYPPPYYWLCTPLHWIPYRWAVYLWLAMLLSGLVAAATIIEQGLRIEHAPASAAWFWPAMLLFPPLLLGLTMGQKGTFWLLILAATWWLYRRKCPLVAGLVFGLLSIKPTLFFLLPLVMLRYGEWRFVAGASLSWGALWGAAACMLPSSVWADFLAVARSAGDYHAHSGYQLVWSSNLQSLGGNLPSWLPNWASRCLLAVPALYVLSCIMLKAKFSLASPLDLCQVLVATCLLSPHFYAYDLVVLLLPICAMWHSQRRAAMGVLAAVWFGMLASRPCLDTIGLPLMPVVLLAALYWLSTVTPGQSSVRKGVSGSPAPSNILQTGLSAQA